MLADPSALETLLELLMPHFCRFYEVQPQPCSIPPSVQYPSPPPGSAFLRLPLTFLQPRRSSSSCSECSAPQPCSSLSLSAGIAPPTTALP